MGIKVCIYINTCGETDDMPKMVGCAPPACVVRTGLPPCDVTSLTIVAPGGIVLP